MTDPLPAEPSVRWTTPLTGPAYRLSAKLFTGGTLLALALYGTHVLARAPGIDSAVLMLMAAGGAVVLVTAWYILTGRTTIDAQGIRQDWMFAKSFGWRDIARAKFLKLPFTSRLLIVTGRGPVRAVHAGSRELEAAFREIAAWYGRR